MLSINIPKKIVGVFVTLAVLTLLTLPVYGQPTFYPNRDRANYQQQQQNYSPNYNYNYSGYSGYSNNEPPLCPLPSQSYGQSYSQPYGGMQDYTSPDMFGSGLGSGFGGFDITSLLGFRMPGSGLELLIILAVYGFRYISVIQQRLKAGDDTLLSQIRENETRQNTELEKLLERLNIFRKETREAHTELSRKIDEVLIKFQNSETPVL
jgi:hypothetical protein